MILSIVSNHVTGEIVLVTPDYEWAIHVVNNSENELTLDTLGAPSDIREGFLAEKGGDFLGVFSTIEDAENEDPSANVQYVKIEG